MKRSIMNGQGCAARPLGLAAAAITSFLAIVTHAAVPGITGTSAPQVFNLTASADFISQPDGQQLFSWGYGCTGSTAATQSTIARFAPAAAATGDTKCPLMQIPGPTLIVHEGDAVTVVLTNKLPRVAGSTSIVFAGFDVTASGGSAGSVVKEAAPNGGTVTYTFKASRPGTYAYYSGSQPDVQIEMGLYGAVIVLPTAAQPGCTIGQYSLAANAYDHPQTCYDREYLFQFSEMNLAIHQAAEAQQANNPPLIAITEPYHPNYFLINGRSMPDLMDNSYSPAYLHQPYNGNPHMHPGDQMLMRVIGHGRWEHSFHFHGNHARMLARDANLLLSANDPLAVKGTQPRLAGGLFFTFPTVSGQTIDAIFAWTGQGLNWDVYGSNPHACNGQPNVSNGQSPGFDPVTHEYCPDHGKPIPVTPPDPQIVANGLWYGGTPYLGMQGNNQTPLPPGFARQNQDAGYAYMWHSHNEREITTNDVFPGGMLMMMIIDPPKAAIDERL